MLYSLCGNFRIFFQHILILEYIPTIVLLRTTNQTIHLPNSSSLMAMRNQIHSQPWAHSRHLTRDRRIQTQTLRTHASITIKQIADVIGHFQGQLRYACAQGDDNIGHHTGFPAVLSTEQADQPVAYIYSSPKALQMSNLGLAMDSFRYMSCSEHDTRGALERGDSVDIDIELVQSLCWALWTKKRGKHG